MERRCTRLQRKSQNRSWCETFNGRCRTSLQAASAIRQSSSTFNLLALTANQAISTVNLAASAANESISTVKLSALTGNLTLMEIKI
jgi:hypothetical protein